MSKSNSQDDHSNMDSYSSDRIDEYSQRSLRIQPIKKESENNLDKSSNYELNETSKNSREDVSRLINQMILYINVKVSQL